MATPKNVVDALSKLESSDQAVIQSYIDDLKSQIPQSETTSKMEEESIPQQESTSSSSDLPQYESGEDYDKATTYKMEAADLKSSGDYPASLEKYNLAITSAPPSALLLANRADVLFRLERFEDAVGDCDRALENNPDSAKACRIRGKSYKELGEYEKARHDLSASQQMDYDDGAAEDLKFVMKKVKEIEGEKVKRKVEEEDRLRKKSDDIRKAREEAKREAEEEEAEASAGMGGGMPDMGGMGGMPGGMPGMGGMGGIPGMGGGGGMGGMGDLMSTLFSDPELAAAMQNPKVMAGLTSLMSNPGKMPELLADPEVGPIMQKIMTKLGPMMGGMGGGAGGMPDMSGMGGGFDADDDDDEMPDLDDLPDLE